jgi:hypothetical protein
MLDFSSDDQTHPGISSFKIVARCKKLRDVELKQNGGNMI